MTFNKKETNKDEKAKVEKEVTDFFDEYDAVVKKIIEHYSLTGLNKTDSEIIWGIVTELAVAKSNNKETSIINHLSIIAKQNLLIIKKLDEISKKLK